MKEPKKVISVAYVKIEFIVLVQMKQPEYQTSGLSSDCLKRGPCYTDLRDVGFHTGMNMICLASGYNAWTAP